MAHPSTGSARDAAFGPDPAAVPPVPSDPLGRWLTAVALGGQGRYAVAWSVLALLLRDPAVPSAIAAHAAVTRASHLRQIGDHARARAYDAQALGRASPATARLGGSPVHDLDGTGPAAARLDALVGLAADAVGLGDAAGAGRLLDATREPVREHRSWRLRVRWGWVRAELALVQGSPADAVAPAGAALMEATAGGSRRHELKSRIVLAVARAAAGDLPAGAAVAELAALEGECAERGLLPLCWPSALAAADLLDRDDAEARPAAAAPAERANDATRRRLAARRTLDVLYSRSDPIGKLQTGESTWHPAQSTVV